MMFSNFNDTQNKNIVNKAIDELKLNPLTDAIPKQVIPTIQPIYKLNPTYSFIVKNASASPTGVTTIYTTESTKDFYLTGFTMAITSDGTCDNTFCILRGYVNGVQTILGDLRKQTTTAGSQSLSLNLSYPLRIDRNTAITIETSFTAGASTRSGTIYGFNSDIGVQSPN